MKNRTEFLRRLLGMLFLLGSTAAWAVAAEGGTEGARAAISADPHETWRAIGIAATASFAVCVSVLGASHAVGRIGSAALGAATEKPELLTRSLLYVALAEGLAVLGFAIGMMLVQKI